MLEAHTITTLSKACQHLVLIGDHQQVLHQRALPLHCGGRWKMQRKVWEKEGFASGAGKRPHHSLLPFQLRPSANVYDLAKNFNLEMSLFERLVKVGLPFVRLNYQVSSRSSIPSCCIRALWEPRVGVLWKFGLASSPWTIYQKSTRCLVPEKGFGICPIQLLCPFVGVGSTSKTLLPGSVSALNDVGTGEWCVNNLCSLLATASESCLAIPESKHFNHTGGTSTNFPILSPVDLP